MPDRLKGKVAVVTGAAPRGEGVGNGMACAILFAREGAKVVLVNRGWRAAPRRWPRRSAQEGGEAAVFAGDVTRPAGGAEAMADFAVEALRPARRAAQQRRPGARPGTRGDGEARGLAPRARREPDQRDLSLEVRHPEDAGGLRRFDHHGVVDHSAPIGLSGNTGGSVAYATAKAGLFGLTYSLAADYAAENIRANCIVIGSVHTPMVAHLGADARERRRRMRCQPNRGHRVGHRAWRRVSRERRGTLGDRHPIADRRRCDPHPAAAALIRSRGPSPS